MGQVNMPQPLTVQQMQALVTLYYSLKSQLKIQEKISVSLLDQELLNKNQAERHGLVVQIMYIEKMPEVMVYVGEVPKWLK